MSMQLELKMKGEQYSRAVLDRETLERKLKHKMDEIGIEKH